MKTTRSTCCMLCGALVWLTSASTPSSATAANVTEMSPQELRALFHQPGFSVPDGLGDYDENYRPVTSGSEEKPQFEKSGVIVSGVDRDTICVALGDALNYLRGRALASRRVAYGSETGILRWYNNHCLIQERSASTRTARSSVDRDTLNALRRMVLTHPQESLDAY